MKFHENRLLADVLMIFHENRLLADVLMKYHTLFFRKLGKMSQNLPSAAVVIGALRVKC